MQSTALQNLAAISAGKDRQALQPLFELIAARYELTLHPSAVVVGTDGRIASRSAAGLDGIRTLIERCQEKNIRVFICSPAITAEPADKPHDAAHRMSGADLLKIVDARH